MPMQTDEAAIPPVAEELAKARLRPLDRLAAASLEFQFTEQRPQEH
jgi:hypothetical protein